MIQVWTAKALTQSPVWWLWGSRCGSEPSGTLCRQPFKLWKTLQLDSLCTPHAKFRESGTKQAHRFLGPISPWETLHKTLLLQALCFIYTKARMPHTLQWRLLEANGSCRSYHLQCSELDPRIVTQPRSQWGLKQHFGLSKISVIPSHWLVGRISQFMDENPQISWLQTPNSSWTKVSQWYDVHILSYFWRISPHQWWPLMALERAAGLQLAPPASNRGALRWCQWAAPPGNADLLRSSLTLMRVAVMVGTIDDHNASNSM